MLNKSNLWHVNVKEIIGLGLFLVAIYVIIPEISGFHKSWQLLAHPNWYWLILSVVFMILTYVLAASTYCLLAFKPLSYAQEFIVQLAAMFVNRLLPAGIGGIGANYAYLRHRDHKAYQAGSIVATNNLLGIVGHILIVLSAVLLYYPKNILPTGSIKKSLAMGLEIIIAVIFIGLLIAIFTKKLTFKKIIKDFLIQVKSYQNRPWKTLSALLTQIGLSICNVLCLSYSAKAVGINLSFVTILIIFSFSTGVRTLTPTPGGLGGFEAGLFAGFITYNVSHSDALAVVLIYRLISYWFPLIIGAVAFIYVSNRKWMST